MSTANGWPSSTASTRPGTAGTDRSALAIGPSSSPSASPAASATSAFAALKRPRSGSEITAWPAGERTVNSLPSRPERCSTARQSAGRSSDTVIAPSRREPPPPLVVDDHDRAPDVELLEQPQLGREVAVHVGVEVEVVLAQVGER